MELESGRIILREYLETDWERVHLYASIPSFTEFEAWGPNSIEDTKQFIKEMLLKKNKKPRYEFEFAIVDKETNLLIGGCGLRKDEAQELVGNIGYAVNPDFQGRGYATEATKILLDYAFRVLHLSVVYATCDSRNIASYSVMTKCKMRQASLSKNKRKFKGKVADELRFEISKNEYFKFNS